MIFILFKGKCPQSTCFSVLLSHQVIVAVSKLMAEGLNRTAVNNSLLALKNYAVEDRGMKVCLILMLGSVVVVLF